MIVRFPRIRATTAQRSIATLYSTQRNVGADERKSPRMSVDDGMKARRLGGGCSSLINGLITAEITSVRMFIPASASRIRTQNSGSESTCQVGSTSVRSGELPFLEATRHPFREEQLVLVEVEPGNSIP